MCVGKDISVFYLLVLVSAATNMANRPMMCFFLKHHTEREMPTQSLAVLVILTQAPDV